MPYISEEALKSLYDIYNTWWNKVGTFEDSTDSSKYCLLLLEDERIMSDAAEKVEPFISEIEAALNIQV